MIQLLHSSVPGAEFGGHTVNHTPETGYDTHIADYMNNEVIPNKAYLANAVGSSIVGFAYPGGFHSVTSDTAILNNYSYVRYTGYTDTLGQFPTGYANQPYVNYQTQTKLYAANAQDSIIKNGNTDNVNLSLSIARLRGQSIVYYMHNLSYDGYSDDQTITAANLTAIIVYAHDNNIQMVNLKQIAYIPVPAANFSVSSFSGINNRTVTYTDLSTGTINNWLWDFGDGTTSTEQNPTHTYAYGNNYPVSLTVSNDGGSNSITQTIPVYGDMARWDLFGGQIKDVIYLILIIPIGLVGYFIIRLFSNEDVDGNTLIMVAVFALVIIISAGILLAILGALSHVA